MKSSVYKSILWVVLPYLVFGGLWIILSDRALNVLGLDMAAHTRVSIAKGWAFVLITAILLALLLRVQFQARSRNEDALRQERDFSNAVLDGLPGVAFCYDDKLRFRRWNKNFMLVSGYTEEEIASMPPLEFFPADQRRLLAERIEEVFQRGYSAVEADFVAKDGSLTPFYLTGTATTLEGRRHLVGVGIDVSQRKQAEGALTESEERLRLALDSARMGTFDWNLISGRIIWSRWHELLWGFSPGEFAGTYEAFCSRVHPEDLPGINSEIARCISSQVPFIHEFRVVWPDQSVHWMCGTGEFKFDDTGKPVRMRGTVTEVTERKLSEEELRLSREQLRALTARLETLREEERTRISRKIHDELGQMLTALKMDLRWIEHRLDEFGTDRRLNPVLDKLTETGELVDATAETVQRIAAEMRPGILDKLGLGTALEYEAARFQERSGVFCRVSVPESEPVLNAEVTTAFFRIFQEALTNVSRHAQATAVEVELKCGNEGCQLVVSDNGRGLTGMDLVNPKSLGLLGMRERARLLGGDLTFTAPAGGGTVLDVHIPIVPLDRSGT